MVIDSRVKVDERINDINFPDHESCFEYRRNSQLRMSEEETQAVIEKLVKVLGKREYKLHIMASRMNLNIWINNRYFGFGVKWVRELVSQSPKDIRKRFKLN